MPFPDEPARKGSVHSGYAPRHVTIVPGRRCRDSGTPARSRFAPRHMPDLALPGWVPVPAQCAGGFPAHSWRIPAHSGKVRTEGFGSFGIRRHGSTTWRVWATKAGIRYADTLRANSTPCGARSASTGNGREPSRMMRRRVREGGDRRVAINADRDGDQPDRHLRGPARPFRMIQPVSRIPSPGRM